MLSAFSSPTESLNKCRFGLAVEKVERARREGSQLTSWEGAQIVEIEDPKTLVGKVGTPWLAKPASTVIKEPLAPRDGKASQRETEWRSDGRTGQ